MLLCSWMLDQECILCLESGQAHSTRPLVVGGRIPVAAVVVVAGRSDYSCSRLAIRDRLDPSIGCSYWGLGGGYKTAMLVIDAREGLVDGTVEFAPSLTFRASVQKYSARENCKHLSELFVLCCRGEFTPIVENRFFLPPSFFSGTTDVDAL